MKQKCQYNECDKTLRSDNKAGYCQQHRQSAPELKATTAASKKKWKDKNPDKVLAQAKKQYDANPEKYRERSRNYAKRNPQKVKQAIALWSKNNRSKINLSKKNRLANDIQYKIAERLRNQVWRALKKSAATKEKTEILIGCSFDNFKKHIESLFLDGMSWENYGEWELDHKTPVSWFNLSDELELKQAFNYNNYQPLWRKDNRVKNNRWAG